MSIDKQGKGLQLSPLLVREIASTISGCHEIKSKSLNILSFMISPLDNKGRREPARIQVYCTTGTVGVCRVLNKQVRQLFKQKCNLKTVEKLLREPPELTPIDPEVVFHSNEDTAGCQIMPYACGAMKDMEPAETGIKSISPTLKVDLLRDAERMDIALTILAGENQSIVSHLTSLRRTLREKETLRRKQMGMSRRKENMNRKHFGSTAVGRKRKVGYVGNNTKNIKNIQTINHKKDNQIAYSLPLNNIEEVKTCLQGASKGEILSCVATNGLQSAFLYKSGKWAATGKILKEKLKKHKKVRYISLGTGGRYFITLKSGRIIWDGPNSMKKYLEGNLGIRCVAFGSNKGTFFVVYSDGSWKFEGSEIPSGLKSFLRSKGDCHGVECVALGPSGEWFLQSESGDMCWGGVSETIENHFDTSIGKDRKTPHFVDFGKHGAFVIIYE